MKPFSYTRCAAVCGFILALAAIACPFFFLEPGSGNRSLQIQTLPQDAESNTNWLSYQSPPRPNKPEIDAIKPKSTGSTDVATLVTKTETASEYKNAWAQDKTQAQTLYQAQAQSQAQSQSTPSTKATSTNKDRPNKTSEELGTVSSTPLQEQELSENDKSGKTSDKTSSASELAKSTIDQASNDNGHDAKSAITCGTDNTTNSAATCTDAPQFQPALAQASPQNSKQDNKQKSRGNAVAGSSNAVAGSSNSATGSGNTATGSGNAAASPDNLGANQQAKLSLQEKVENITKKQTAEQKEAYQESLQQRKELVDAAIASIEKHASLYVPPFLGSRALVVYFGPNTLPQPLTVKAAQALKVDGKTGATYVLVPEKGRHKAQALPALEYIAQTLSKASGARLYQITTTNTYPRTIDNLYEVSKEELNNQNYPELTDDEPLSIDDYDTLYLCYPNWWHDMPGAFYSFLDKYDLSNKTIVPICLADKDSFANTIGTIAMLEPNAMVYDQGLLINRAEAQDESKLHEKLVEFLQKLSTTFN